MTDPVILFSNAFVKDVLVELRAERSNIRSRIRYACDAANSEEDIEVQILGTGEITLSRLRSIASRHIEAIYLESVARSITDIATVDHYHPVSIPANITKADREEGAVSETNYLMSLLATTVKIRNDAIKRIILSRSKGITKLIDDVEADINRRWIPRIEEDIRIGCNHAWNAGYYTRLIEHVPFKKWVSGSDHDDMNSVVVPVNEPFKVPDQLDPENLTKKIPGCLMLYPGDISDNPDRRHLERCFCRIVPCLKGPVETANVTDEDLTTANEPNEEEPVETKKSRRKKGDEE
jgi:hypothetical protein